MRLPPTRTSASLAVASTATVRGTELASVEVCVVSPHHPCSPWRPVKIVIRGDRRAGKSALLAALQGLPFASAYTPTDDEIKVANVAWSYKTADDLVRVEVWDVVDRSSRRNQHPDQPCADAAFLDVYKGAHGAILVYDMANRMSFHYAQHELARVPADLPVLLLVRSPGFERPSLTPTHPGQRAGRWCGAGGLDGRGDGVAGGRRAAQERQCGRGVRRGLHARRLRPLLRAPLLQPPVPDRRPPRAAKAARGQRHRPRRCVRV
jgi:hypothetical protein